MKTTKEWIDTLPQDIRERAYKYTDGLSLTLLQSTLCCAISCLFVWSKTSEGYKFWSLVANGKFDQARQLLKTNTKKRHYLMKFIEWIKNIFK